LPICLSYEDRSAKYFSDQYKTGFPTALCIEYLRASDLFSVSLATRHTRAYLGFPISTRPIIAKEFHLSLEFFEVGSLL